jgi:hypothetical protein
MFFRDVGADVLGRCANQYGSFFRKLYVLGYDDGVLLLPGARQ